MAKYNTQDPPTDYDCEKLPDTKKFLEKFTETKIPVLPTPRFDPLIIPKETVCRNPLFKIIAVELALACVPLLAGLYGGDGYTNNAVTFRDSLVGYLNARLMFTVMIMIVIMVNSVLFVARRSAGGGDISATWEKLSCLALVITIAAMLRAGESRMEVVAMASLFAATAFSVPAYTESLSSIVIPAACFLATEAYAFFVKLSDMHAVYPESEMYLDITVVLFCMSVPQIVLCMAVVVYARKSSNERRYLVIELALVCCMCIMALIPNTVPSTFISQ